MKGRCIWCSICSHRWIHLHCCLICIFSIISSRIFGIVACGGSQAILLLFRTNHFRRGSLNGSIFSCFLRTFYLLLLFWFIGWAIFEMMRWIFVLLFYYLYNVYEFLIMEAIRIRITENSRKYYRKSLNKFCMRHKKSLQ